MPTDSVSKKYMVFTNFLRAYGEFLKALGDIEKETGRTIDELAREIYKPEIYNELTEKVPPELLNKFFHTLFSIASLQIKRVNEMTPNEKIETGTRLIELADRLEEIIEEIESVVRGSD